MYRWVEAMIITPGGGGGGEASEGADELIVYIIKNRAQALRNTMFSCGQIHQLAETPFGTTRCLTMIGCSRAKGNDSTLA